ncbi:unnamed protein product, partial [Mesorhabditis spiculigera]
MPTGPSRFAVLKIEDDSDEEFKTPAQNKPKNNPKSTRTILPDGLIVHKQEKKRKGKKKPQIVEAETVLFGSAVANEESTDDEELKEALKRSLAAEDVAGVRAAVSGPSIPDPKPVDPRLEGLLTSMMEKELVKLKQELHEEREKKHLCDEERTKYKLRYNKLLELLQEAELKEHVLLVQDLKKKNATIRDLSHQLDRQQQEIEKLRSMLPKK